MSFTVRSGVPDDFDGIQAMMRLAFHDNPDDPELAKADRMVFEPARSLVAVDGLEIVGHAGAYTRDLTVPGSVIPAAFVTMVAVAGTHRRQGVATQMLTKQLHDARAAGEPVAVLWASEGRIYQRFGYGMATRQLGLDIETREVRLLPPRSPGSRIRSGYAAELRKDAAAVYDVAVAQRPGYASRPGNWWDHLLFDPASRRRGFGRQRLAVHDGPSGMDGYALFRVKAAFDNGGPRGEVSVAHVVANNPVAYIELWRWLLDIDLTRSAVLRLGSVDEPLLDIVDEPRRLRATLGDGLWLRVLDVSSALAGRRYPTDSAGNLVIEVTDPLIGENNGRFTLDGARSTASPDLTLDIATLGNLYLGGGSAGALADGGRIAEHRPGAVAAAGAAFRWHRAPVGIDKF